MKIIKSKRKTLSLRITKEGEVEVRAPRLCPDFMIRAFIEKHQAWIDRQLAAFQPPKTYTEQELKELRRRAKEVIPPKVEHYAVLMGVTPASVKITAARTRYGSCSGKNGLCFSLFLMEKSERCIDYVVVHELAHIKQHNHSPAFYREIEKILPDYRARVKELKE